MGRHKGFTFSPEVVKRIIATKKSNRERDKLIIKRIKDEDGRYYPPKRKRHKKMITGEVLTYHTQLGKIRNRIHTLQNNLLTDEWHDERLQDLIQRLNFTMQSIQEEIKIINNYK